MVLFIGTLPLFLLYGALFFTRELPWPRIFQTLQKNMSGEADTLRGMRRAGADGRDALFTSQLSPRIIPPGRMPLKDLAPTDPGFPRKPCSTIVEGVRWCTPKKPSGLLVFPSSFSGEIATDIATPETLGYYGAKFANRTEERIEVNIEHQQTNFTYAENYLHNYVLVDKEKGGAGGATLERHSFCHTDTPFQDLDSSGVFVIGKFLDESETQLELTGFLIPRNQTLWVPAGVIHTNNYLKGKWNTMLKIGEPIDAVELIRDGKQFSFTFGLVAICDLIRYPKYFQTNQTFREPLCSPQPEFEHNGWIFNDCLLLHRLLLTYQGWQVEEDTL